MARTSRRRHTGATFQRGYIGNIAEAVRKLEEKGSHVLIAAKLALAAGVDQIIEDAKSRCPVETGNLRNSIKAIETNDGAAYEITADATNNNGIAYGQFVEFAPWGTPFLYPAMDAHRDEIKRDIEEAIAAALARR